MTPRSRKIVRFGPVLAVASLLALSGCGSTKTTGTVRSASEQLLLTNAWDDAVRKIDFRPLAGVPVYLDVTNMTAIDQGWAVSSLRRALLSDGALIKPKIEQAQWVVEASVGTYGTNDHNFLVGVAQTTIPQTITGMPSGTIPEIPLIKSTDQQAVVKMAIFAYDRTSGQLVWKPETSLATATAKNIFVGGVGPIQSGTIIKKNRRLGTNIPMISDPELSGDGTSTGSKPSADRSNLAPPPGAGPPPMGLPASAGDLQSFAPGP